MDRLGETGNFSLLEDEFQEYLRSSVVILPVPFERTTSYGKGTAKGPAAIIEASHQVEWYDEELCREPFRQGIHTAPYVRPEGTDMAAALAEIEAAALPYLQDGKFLVTLGGEHSLTLAPVRAAAACHGEIGVVQFDAHGDLRNEYEGSPYSHASVMRRIVDDVRLPTLAVGLRAISQEEGDLIRERDLKVLWGYELPTLTLERWRSALEALPEKVYLTFDLDFFDPSLLPATGTPEPGGGTWWPTMALLRELFVQKDVVAMDVVELAPTPHHHASDFTAARLIYKCLGYRLLR
ncbi:MAG: agmatinase [Acidobacteria bacterium]|nr:agmatinase [Acidobacteriota bacterium]